MKEIWISTIKIIKFVLNHPKNTNKIQKNKGKCLTEKKEDFSRGKIKGKSFCSHFVEI